MDLVYNAIYSIGWSLARTWQGGQHDQAVEKST